MKSYLESRMFSPTNGLNVKTTDITSAEFDILARTYLKTAFRMEMLPQYLVDHLNPNFKAFLAGDPIPPPNPAGTRWSDMIREHVAAGRIMARVHILPDKLTPYLKYEIEWGYTKNAVAGDDIRIMLPDRCDQELRRVLTQDFWIFDDELVVLVDYDPQGRFKGLRQIGNGESIAIYQDAKRLSWERSIPLSEFLSLWRQNKIYS